MGIEGERERERTREKMPERKRKASEPDGVISRAT